jgi:hypothetical protein
VVNLEVAVRRCQALHNLLQHKAFLEAILHVIVKTVSPMH